MSRHPGHVLTAAAAVVLLQACSSTPTSGPTAAPPSSKPSNVVSPAVQIDVRLELEHTTTKAGSEIHGVLVVDNRTLRPIKTQCGFSFAAGITSDEIPFRPAFALVCAINQSVPVGVTRYPVTIITTYDSCSQSGQQDGSMPGCLPGPMGAGSKFTVAPPLPAGAYRTSVVLNGLPGKDVRLPAPTSVTLT